MLLIINKEKIMLVTKQNPSGGPSLNLRKLHIKEDPDTGMFGYPIGYCPCGCGQPIMIRTVDMKEIVGEWGWVLEDYNGWRNKLKPKEPFRHRLIKALGGKVREGD